MRYWIWSLLLTVAALHPLQAADAISFEALLAEGGLEFRPPQGFHPVAVEADYVMPYEARYRSEDGELEIRYAIRPLNRIEIDYQDPHNAAPAPNDLFNMLFRTLSETLAVDHQVISRVFPPEKAREEYRAGWVAAGVFDLSPDISKEYREAMLFAIHQNDKADAYLLFLTNDLASEKTRIRKTRDSLRFRRYDHGINQPPGEEELKNLPMIPETPATESG
ncbi:hypothetical protein [Thiolapillus sp.]